LTEEPQKKYRCGDCNKEWTETESVCSNCGSTRKCSPVSAEGTIAVRSGILLKCRDSKGKQRPDWRYKSASTVSFDGKEVRECYCADKNRNWWSQTVKVQDKNGDWKVTHQEDEPLNKHCKKESAINPKRRSGDNSHKK
jgi:hypothetical protein